MLKPGARFGIYDLLQGDGEVLYPVPWARDPATSFVVRPGELRALLEAAGSDVELARYRGRSPPLVGADARAHGRAGPAAEYAAPAVRRRGQSHGAEPFAQPARGACGPDRGDLSQAVVRAWLCAPPRDCPPSPLERDLPADARPIRRCKRARWWSRSSCPLGAVRNPGLTRQVLGHALVGSEPARRSMVSTPARSCASTASPTPRSKPFSPKAQS